MRFPRPTAPASPSRTPGCDTRSRARRMRGLPSPPRAALRAAHLLAAAALAGCQLVGHGGARGNPPVPVPAPATVASAGAAGEAMPAPVDDSAGAPADAVPDVTTEAVHLFGDSVAQEPSPQEDAEPTWDIDVRSYETHARVGYYLERFRGPAHERFAEELARGGKYEPMIRSTLRAAGLPEDLAYVALIESGYDPNAYSRAAAVGMWQFMTSTARGTGLRVDWWMDERRDPVRSTQAAAKFLGWLQDQFGSLYLAVAAYNGGPGRLERGLTRYADELDGATGNDAFFALAETNHLRAETRDYVPKLIAAALIAKEPRRYGFNITYDAPLAYDTVRVAPYTSLAAVAAAAGVPPARVLDLNPAVLRAITPPRDSVTVRVPAGTAAGFDGAFAALPDSVRSGVRRLTSHKGETRLRLARRAGVSVGMLVGFNPHLRAARTGRVVAGQTVLVPTSAVVRLARNVPDPEIERYGGSATGRTVTHVVRHGESLSVIAHRYHTSVAALMRLNGLRKSIIFPGQVIVVRSRARSSGARMASGGRTHVVRHGETLTSIAHKYGLTVEELRQLNGLHGDFIREGQRLTVRG